MIIAIVCLGIITVVNLILIIRINKVLFYKGKPAIKITKQ